MHLPGIPPHRPVLGHCRVEQQQFQSEMDRLQRALEAKQAQMQRVVTGSGQMSALKQHYDRMLTELAQERDHLQQERSQLLQASLDVKQNKGQLIAYFVFDHALASCGREYAELRAGRALTQSVLHTCVINLDQLASLH